MNFLLLANQVDFSFAGMWAQMGFIAKVVLVFLVIQFAVSLALTVERMLAYGRATSQSKSYVLALRNAIEQNQLENGVTAAATHADSPVAKVCASGLREYLKGLEALREEGPADVGDFDIVDAVNRQMERAKERETARLKKYLTLLATNGSTAPFIGLFGTVVGVINSFQGMSSDGGGGLSSVAGGISEALIATAVGLVAAIPAVMAFNWANSKVEDYQIDMNDVASELIDYVLKEGRY